MKSLRLIIAATLLVCAIPFYVAGSILVLASGFISPDQ